MADFCTQCALAIFGEDNGDLAGLIAEHRVALGFVATCICEGCGPTFVDHTGKCVNKHCLHKHGAAGDVEVIPGPDHVPMKDPATIPTPVCPNCRAKVWHVKAHWVPGNLIMREGWSCTKRTDENDKSS